MVKSELVATVVQKIQTEFHPQKVILFGSYAWGNPGQDSDIDLFIVMDSSLRRDERELQIRKLFSDRTYPLDVIVYTPAEIEESVSKGNPFIIEILSRGLAYV